MVDHSLFSNGIKPVEIPRASEGKQSKSHDLREYTGSSDQKSIHTKIYIPHCNLSRGEAVWV